MEKHVEEACRHAKEMRGRTAGYGVGWGLRNGGGRGWGGGRNVGGRPRGRPGRFGALGGDNGD